MTIALFPRRGQEADFVGASQFLKLTRKVLIVCPFAVTGLLAAYTRGHTDNFERPCATPVYDMQMLAYGPYVKAVKQTLRGDASKDRNAILALAKDWDEAVKQDKLVPVTPVSFEDSIEEGARGSILRAKARLVSALEADAAELAHEGQVKEAADETLLAMRLSESLKYGDFNTVYASSIEEKKQSDFLRRLMPQMDDSTKSAVRAQLSQVAARGGELDDLTRASRVQYYDWMMRMSKQAVTIEDVHQTSFVTKRIVSDPESRDTLQYIKSAITEKAQDTGPEYLTELRLAWKAERTNQDRIQKLIKDL